MAYDRPGEAFHRLEHALADLLENALPNLVDFLENVVDALLFELELDQCFALPWRIAMRCCASSSRRFTEGSRRL